MKSLTYQIPKEHFPLLEKLQQHHDSIRERSASLEAEYLEKSNVLKDEFMAKFTSLSIESQTGTAVMMKGLCTALGIPYKYGCNAEYALVTAAMEFGHAYLVHTPPKSEEPETSEKKTLH